MTFSEGVEGTFETPDGPVCFEFTADEWQTLTMFVEQCRELEATTLAQMGLPLNLQMNFDVKTGLDARTELPHDDLIAALLMKLRPLILEQEPASFVKVVSMLGRRIGFAPLHKAVKEERERFFGKGVEAVFKFSIDESLVNSEKLLKTYLNGFHYHRDLEKRAKIRELHQLIPLEYSLGLFLILLGEKGGAALRVAEFIRPIVDLLEKKQSVPFQPGLLSMDVPSAPTEA